MADIVVGFSDYLQKIDYSLDKWMEELHAMMEQMKSLKPPSRKAGSGGQGRPNPLRRAEEVHLRLRSSARMCTRIQYANSTTGFK